MVMLLSPEDHARIEAAISAAEAATRGEIACVVGREASHYPEVPLAWAAAAALVLPLAPLTLGAAAAWLDAGLRGWNVGHVAASHATVMTVLGGYALTQCLVFILVALLVSIPPLRRAMTPAQLRRSRVHQRAMEQFRARGVDRTRDRTGVLIYVSLEDRIAEVIADAGINDRVDRQVWSTVITALTASIKRGQTGEGLVAAVSACGRLLGEHFPATGANSDELPNAVVEMREA